MTKRKALTEEQWLRGTSPHALVQHLQSRMLLRELAIKPSSISPVGLMCA